MRTLPAMALMHLAANGVLLLLGYYWLGVPESHAAMLVWSLCLALCIVVLGCWTYGAAFAYFGFPVPLRPLQAWRAARHNIVPLAVAIVLIALIYWLLAKWADYSAQPAFRIASYMTQKLRTPVRPAAVGRVFGTGLWLVRWMVLPVLFLPMLSTISALGWRGFFGAGLKVRRWLYWIETPVLLLCAVRVPLLLLKWVPHVNGFRVEAVSFALRAGIAYLLFGAAGLLLAFATSGGRPRDTQLSTDVLP